MYKGLLFLMVICSVTGFNNQISPVKHFTKDDPLFGKTAIQSKDGVFVPSPTNGKLFSCTLEDECVKVNFNDEKPKGLRPVASVASILISEDHLVMCNQVRIKESVTENLNGNCQLMNPIGKGKLNPAKLVLNQMEKKPTSSNNNNNNNNRGGRIDQGKWRMRRDTQPDSETKTAENDDNAGTEIAFVLDGSGSIQHDDFQRAKDFIYNVMLSVWKACFNCNFAIVQYGSRIRTELSLLDNKDRVRTLQKVKEIQQIYNLTKTASAIHHVLTNIFIPENGSKKTSKKIIIVLSDGKILGDPMHLTDVLNMPQMKDVIRYSIGVGEGILSNPEAIKEMKDIADPDKYFSVSSYAGLDDIFSSLQQSLIGIKDIDVSGQAKCAHSCANVPGLFRCVCNLGIELDSDENHRYRPSDFHDVENTDGIEGSKLKNENFCIKRNVT